MPRTIIPVLTLLVIAMTSAGFTCAPSFPPVETICEDAAAPASGKEVQIGTEAMGAFSPTQMETPYMLDFGNQGGQHIFTSLRFYLPEAMDSANYWTHEFELVDPDNAQRSLGGRVVAAAEDCAQGQWAVTHQLRVFVDSSTTTRARLRVKTQQRDLTDTVIEEFSDEAIITIQ